MRTTGRVKLTQQATSYTLGNRGPLYISSLSLPRDPLHTPLHKCDLSHFQQNFISAPYYVFNNISIALHHFDIRSACSLHCCASSVTVCLKYLGRTITASFSIVQYLSTAYVMALLRSEFSG
jgi:hypothetical protein